MKEHSITFELPEDLAAKVNSLMETDAFAGASIEEVVAMLFLVGLEEAHED